MPHAERKRCHHPPRRVVTGVTGSMRAPRGSSSDQVSGPWRWGRLRAGRSSACRVGWPPIVLGMGAWAIHRPMRAVVLSLDVGSCLPITRQAVVGVIARPTASARSCLCRPSVGLNLLPDEGAVARCAGVGVSGATRGWPAVRGWFGRPGLAAGAGRAATPTARPAAAPGRPGGGGARATGSSSAGSERPPCAGSAGAGGRQVGPHDAAVGVHRGVVGGDEARDDHDLDRVARLQRSDEGEGGVALDGFFRVGARIQAIGVQAGRGRPSGGREPARSTCAIARARHPTSMTTPICCCGSRCNRENTNCRNAVTALAWFSQICAPDYRLRKRGDPQCIKSCSQPSPSPAC
jgi:hypothetical protein